MNLEFWESHSDKSLLQHVAAQLALNTNAVNALREDIASMSTTTTDWHAQVTAALTGLQSSVTGIVTTLQNTSKGLDGIAAQLKKLQSTTPQTIDFTDVLSNISTMKTEIDGAVTTAQADPNLPTTTTTTTTPTTTTTAPAA